MMTPMMRCLGWWSELVSHTISVSMLMHQKTLGTASWLQCALAATALQPHRCNVPALMVITVRMSRFTSIQHVHWLKPEWLQTSVGTAGCASMPVTKCLTIPSELQPRTSSAHELRCIVACRLVWLTLSVCLTGLSSTMGNMLRQIVAPLQDPGDAKNPFLSVKLHMIHACCISPCGTVLHLKRAVVTLPVVLGGSTLTAWVLGHAWWHPKP